MSTGRARLALEGGGQARRGARLRRVDGGAGAQAAGDRHLAGPAARDGHGHGSSTHESSHERPLNESRIPGR